LIFLGRITKTRSNKGEIVCQPSSGIGLNNFKKGEIVLLKSSKYQISQKIDQCREIQGLIVLKFSDVNTIHDAFKLVGYSIYRQQTDEISTESDNILNFEVWDVHNNKWGKVYGIKQEGLNTVLEIHNQHKVYFIPFHQSIIIKIDYKTSMITIDPPDGLMDINEQ